MRNFADVFGEVGRHKFIYIKDNYYTIKIPKKQYDNCDLPIKNAIILPRSLF